MSVADTEWAGIGNIRALPGHQAAKDQAESYEGSLLMGQEPPSLGKLS